MPLILSILIFFWCVKTLKAVLFWLYLWQLKDYHIGRFIDHFRTHKGKKLAFDPLMLVKIGLLAVLFFVQPTYWLVAYVLAALHVGESLLFLRSLIYRTVKKPVVTAKTMFLTSASFGLVFLYLGWVLSAQHKLFHMASLVGWLLIFDILMPVIISAIVLIFQPLFVMARTRILHKAAEKIARFPKLKVIGITGSYGKTSTKEFLTTMLAEKFKVLSTPDHKNSEIGIAQTILESLNESHEIFIVEMGSYGKGGIKLLCDMVRPHMGMVTGVNEQHLATFGSLENLLSAEGGRELLENLPQDGLLVVNGDNKYCVDLYKSARIPKKIYSVKKDTVNADIWTEDVAVKKDGISFIAIDKDKEVVHIDANVLGKQHVQNLLGAVLVAKELGMKVEEITAAVKHIIPEQAGMTFKTGAHGITVIDASYSSNPDGVMADLDYLAVYEGKKVVVMPCLIELGAKSAEIHVEIGKKMARVCDLAIITSKDKFKELSEGFLSQRIPQHKMLLLENPQEIFTMITTMCKQGDAVLLEGRVPGGLIKLLNEKQV